MLGELIVNLSVEGIDLELFRVKSKKRELVDKERVDKKLALSEFSKVDGMEIEGVVKDFLIRSGYSRGKVHFIVDGDESVTRFRDVFIEVANKRAAKRVLPMQVENLGEDFTEFDYRYTLRGKDADIYFIKRSVIQYLSEIRFPSRWEFGYVLSGLDVISGVLAGNGVVVKLTEDRAVLHSFKNGLLVDTETVNDLYAPEGTPNELVESIQESVVDFVASNRLEHYLEVDKVQIVLNSDFNADFEDYESEGIRFLNIVDKNSQVSIQVPEEPKVKMFYPIGNTLAMFNKRSELKTYDFSPEKLGLLYKNITVFAITASLLGGVAMHSMAWYTDIEIESGENTLSQYESLVDDYGILVEDLKGSIEINDSLVDDYNSYVRSLENLQSVNQYFVSDSFKFLPDNTPTNIVVESVRTTKNNRNIVLTGKSVNYREIGAYAIQLEDLGEVDVESISGNDLDNEYGYDFRMTVQSR